MNAKTPISLYDTTLRDGTQGTGFSLSGIDKLRLAKHLDDFGMHYIEGGWPGSNPKDITFFEKAKQMTWKNSKIASFGSTRRANTSVDSDPQVELLLQAETPVVTIFGKSWGFQVTEVLKTSLEENINMVAETIAFLKSMKREVFFDAEHFFDGYKEDPQYSKAIIQAASQGGADAIIFCDTNGGTLPSEVSTICQAVKTDLAKTPFGIHTHNDCELGVANALAAVECGASQVQGTLNGYGERTGNCNLTSLIPLLQLKKYIPLVANLPKLKNLSYFVDDISNNPHFSRAPFVGKTAFSHKGGMHVNAVKKNSKSYEHIKPQSVGNSQYILVSELSGQSNVLLLAEKLGFPLKKGSPQVKEVLKLIKQNEEVGYSYEAAGGSFELLVRKALSIYKPFFQFKSFSSSDAGSTGKPQDYCQANLVLAINNQDVQVKAFGEGIIHALDQAARKVLLKIYPNIDQVKLLDYKVRILDTNCTTAAKTRVLIVHSDGQKNWGTVGVSTSVVAASLYALLDGLDIFLQRGYSAQQA